MSWQLRVMARDAEEAVAKLDVEMHRQPGLPRQVCSAIVDMLCIMPFAGDGKAYLLEASGRLGTLNSEARVKISLVDWTN